MCEHLHLPMQSGSDRTLARMHRGYTAARYLERLAAARAAIPDLAVTTDIIVGFPGETEADFEATLAVADDGRVRLGLHVRLLAPARHRGGRDDRRLHRARRRSRNAWAACSRSSNRHALVKHQARIGRVEEVLVVGPSKRDPAVFSGRTRQNKLVHFAPERGAAAGDLVDVEITDAAPHWMRGRIVADPAELQGRSPVATAAVASPSRWSERRWVK